MDPNHAHSNEGDAAIVAPGPEYLVSVAELGSANIKLLNDRLNMFARVKSVGQEFQLDFRSDTKAKWIHMRTGTDLKDIVREAADLVGLSYTTKTCPQTGLEDLYLNTQDCGCLLIDERDQFPIHIAKSYSNPFTPTNDEFLIEAPVRDASSDTEGYNYNIYTRHCVEDEWEALHSCYEDLSPGEAVDRFSAITDLETVMIDSESGVIPLYEEPNGSDPKA